MFIKLSCLRYKSRQDFKGEMTIQTLYAANGGAILPVFSNMKMLIISIFTAFTGVHGSEREHFGVL
jgi:hypothetical protein